MSLDIQKQTKNFKIRLAILKDTNLLESIRLMVPRGLKVMYQKCKFFTFDTYQANYISDIVCTAAVTGAVFGHMYGWNGKMLDGQRHGYYNSYLDHTH